MIKRCRKCNKLKKHHKHTRSKNGLQYWCIDCRKTWKHEERKQYFRNFYHHNKKQWLDSHLRHTYGISLDEYNTLFKKQHKKCAICLNFCSSGRRLAVDHCHKTNIVRGLLCANCNAMIAHALDNIKILKAGINYLKRKYRGS